jgi:hypothetical protein
MGRGTISKMILPASMDDVFINSMTKIADLTVADS